jgi:peptide/nickel transport system substrate-binding protein
MNKIAIIGVIIILVVAGLGIAVISTGEQRDDTMTVAISSDVNSWYLDKFADGDGRFVWSQIYETLVRLDTDLEVVPGLAESWYSPDGGSTWIFNLTQGVIFHDGSEFDAEAVMFSYSDVLVAKRWGILSCINQTTAIDDHTVQFTFKKQVNLPYYLTHVAWPIMSPNMANETGSWNGQVIGTGPFRFQQQITDQEIRLERNDDYWGEEAKFENLVFKVVTDPTTRMFALKSGDVDMILKVSENDVSDLKTTSGISVQETVTTFTDFLQFNTKSDPYNISNSPFHELAVRKAVAYAVDTEAIVEDLLMGHAVAAKGRACSPNMMYDDPDLELYDVDLETADQLLNQSGWVMESDGYRYKNGSRLATTLLMTSEDSWAPRFGAMADVIADMLLDMGMDVTVEKVPISTFNSKEAAGDFGMILRTGYFVWGPYPKHYFLHVSYGVWSHFQDASYTQLEAEADATTDPEEQEELYHQLASMVIDELPAFYLDHEHKIVAYRDCVKGYQITSEDPWLNLEGVYIVR